MHRRPSPVLELHPRRRPEPEPRSRVVQLSPPHALTVVVGAVRGGPRGAGHVLVTFATDGSVADVQVDRDPYKTSPVARCLVSQFKTAKVPAFGPAAVTVGKNFSID